MKSLTTALLAIGMIGCSSTSNNEISTRNTLTTIGNEKASIAQVVLNIKELGVATHQFVVNVPKYSTDVNFSTCEETGKYQKLLSVTTDKDGNRVPNYVALQVNCDSMIRIEQAKNGEYLVDYDLTFLTGYDTVPVGGIDGLLPTTLHLSNQNYILAEGDQQSLGLFPFGGNPKHEVLIYSTNL